MDNIIEQAEMEMLEAIDTLDKRLLNIRAGRANPTILNGVMVSYYGVPTPLKQLANISIPEARQLCIKPFDKSALAAIEKGIYEANVGLTPNNNGETIILNIPVLTEDTRKEYVKDAKKMAEEAKIILRNVRQDANNSIKRLNSAEDEEKNAMADIQNLIDKYNKVVDDKLRIKEQELMSI